MKGRLIETFFIAVGIVLLILFVVEMKSQQSLGIFRPLESYDGKILDNTRTLEDLNISVKIESKSKN